MGGFIQRTCRACSCLCFSPRVCELSRLRPPSFLVYGIYGCMSFHRTWHVLFSSTRLHMIEYARAKSARSTLSHSRGALAIEIRPRRAPGGSEPPQRTKRRHEDTTTTRTSHTQQYPTRTMQQEHRDAESNVCSSLVKCSAASSNTYYPLCLIP